MYKQATRTYKGSPITALWKGIRARIGYFILGNEYKWYIVGLGACEIYARDNIKGDGSESDIHLEMIFSLAHGCDVNHQCSEQHNDWRDRAFDIFRTEYPAQ